jgi:hypothetical protein
MLSGLYKKKAGLSGRLFSYTKGGVPPLLKISVS